MLFRSSKKKQYKYEISNAVGGNMIRRCVLDLFYGDFVGDISEVRKRKLIKKHLFHELVSQNSFPIEKK